MSVGLICVYCRKPLVDVENAKDHSVNKCPESPAKNLADALVESRLIMKQAADLLDRYAPPNLGHAVRMTISKVESTLREVGRIK